MAEPQDGLRRLDTGFCKRCERTTRSIPCPGCDGPACAGCGRCPPCDGPVPEPMQRHSYDPDSHIPGNSCTYCGLGQDDPLHAPRGGPVPGKEEDDG